jgi:hypothetical protein
VLQAFADRAAAEGATVLRGHCVDFGAAGLPYLAFAEAIGSHLSATSSAVPAALATLLGQPGGDRTAADPGQRDAAAESSDVEVGRMQLFEQVARYVGALASASPVLLVLEDLHWADPSSRTCSATCSAGCAGSRCWSWPATAATTSTARTRSGGSSATWHACRTCAGSRSRRSTWTG